MAYLKQPVSPGDHTRGAQNPKIQIVEYGDFQCPYCKMAEPIVRNLLEIFGSDISITFRNFPLTELHAYAFDAACAAEAAGKQGKYWQMHDLIYDHQANLNDDLFLKLAKRLDLDETKFFSDTINMAVHEKIKADFETGAESGVNGTPTFFIDGKRFDGPPEGLITLISDNFE